ncbi:integrase, catalytic region, zinc finger, CCHC-type containing protein, partial [Tanacetum coccineum]
EIQNQEIDTKPNSELIHHCLQNPPYTYQWAEKTVPVAEGSSETTTERYIENYKNVSQDIRDQLNAEAEAVQIILIRIDNDIYSKVDACPNACKMWKAIERLKQGESINVQDLETNLFWGELEIHITDEWQRFTEDEEMSKEKEIDKLMALISLSFKKIYKPTNNNLRTSSNTSRANQDNSPRINRGTGYDNQRAVNVAGARENVGTLVVQKSGIQCYNCKEYKGNVSRENVRKRNEYRMQLIQGKDVIVVNKRKKSGVQLNAEQADWKDDTDDESDDQELEAHYMYMAQIQEVTPDLVDNSGPIFDDEPMHKLMFKDLKKFQAELDKYNDVNYVSKVEIDCAKTFLAKTAPLQSQKSVTTQNVSHDFSKPVTAQILPQNVLPTFKNTNVIAPGMYKVHTKPNQNRTPRLPQDIRKTNKCVSFSTRVIPTTSVRRPQLKSNQMEDRVMPNNSQGKKEEVEDHCRNFKFSNNKTSVTASKTRQPIAVPISTREPKHNVNQSVATSGKKTVATDSTVKKSRHTTRKLYEQGNDLLTGSHGTNLYSITLQDSTSPNLIFLMAKATSSQAWLWHLRTDKGMEFLNKTLHAYFATEGIRHKTSTARTSEQNGVVERRNRTLVEAARTMLSAAKVPLFFWAEAIATACFTQNRSLVIPRHEKTPYHIINARKPSVKFFHIFGSLCFIVRDGENLDKMKEKVETIHVNFDELPQMASDHVSSDPGPQCSTTVLEQESLSPDPQSQENVPQVAETETTSNELELLYSLMFSELLNGTSPVVSKSSVVPYPPPLNIHSTHQTPTQVPTVTAPENIIQAETNTENAQFDEDEFINIFSTPVQEQGETSSRHVDSSNMHTFYQHHPSAQVGQKIIHLTKSHWKSFSIN